jgi:membrane-bound inhibitor of C-type lysozyme
MEQPVHRLSQHSGVLIRKEKVIKMKYLLIIIVILVFVAFVDGYACENSHRAIGFPAAEERCQCDDGQSFSVAYSKDHKDAYLYDDNHRRIIRMVRVSSKSGEKYISGTGPKKNTFWKKDKTTFIELNEEIYKNCKITSLSGNKKTERDITNDIQKLLENR